MCQVYFHFAHNPQVLCVIVHYCLQFVVVEADGKTAGWSSVALARLLHDVFVLLSGCLNIAAAWVENVLFHSVRFQ